MVTPRERARERTLAEIHALAWRHLEDQGAAGLSLRVIARDLGVVSSAIYRYVPSRDELLTELIIDGYRDLAEHAEQAEAELVAAGVELTGPLVAAAAGAHPSNHAAEPAPVSARQRWLTVARAMRTWAIARPAAWALLFGSPVPGYDAPAERTTPIGTRTIGQMVRIVADALQAGVAISPAIGVEDVPVSLLPGLRAGAESVGLAGSVGIGEEGEPHVVAATVLGWNAILAAITSEVFEQLGSTHFGDAEAWADLAFVASADLVGLPRS